MAALLGCDAVSLEYPTKVILKDVTLGVAEGDRIGIVGKNGDGKVDASFGACRNCRAR